VVFQLTYVSSAVRPWTQAELVGLLEQARTHNAERAVTRMLLYRDGRFLQLLEGAEGEVRALYARITADARHRDRAVVRTRRRLLRQFPGWTMAFRDLGAEPLTTPGYADVLGDAAAGLDPVVADLVARLRGSDPYRRAAPYGSRVLGPFRR
jgi:Sensors of blue-light using FAD